MLVRIQFSTYPSRQDTGAVKREPAAPFSPVVLAGRSAVRGPLLSCLMHGLLILGISKVGYWMADPDATWFERGASITYLHLQGTGAGLGSGVLYFPAAESASGPRAAPKPASGTHPSRPLKTKHTKMAAPPDLRFSAGQAMRLPEAGMVALVRHSEGARVPPPDSPAEAAVAGSSAEPVSPRSAGELSSVFDSPGHVGIPAMLAMKPPADTGEVRLVHPENGEFDVVLVQSTPDLSLQPLKGAPVYSVYLDVGTRKNWMLHFCEREPAVEITEHVVRIGAVEPIAAPYPKVTVVPESLADGASREPLAISAIIEEDGRLSHLETLNESNEGLLKALMSAFESWLFRPAKRKGTPVAVQVVLVIPGVDQKDH